MINKEEPKIIKPPLGPKFDEKSIWIKRCFTRFPEIIL
jgi:hypothetical protein